MLLPTYFRYRERLGINIAHTENGVSSRPTPLYPTASFSVEAVVEAVRVKTERWN